MSNYDLMNLIIGGGGLLLAIISLGWQIYTEIKSKKPKLKGSLSCGGSIEHKLPFIRLDIHNSGQVPVYIKDVQLCWGNKNTHKIGDSTYSCPFQSREDKNCSLEPGQGRDFFVYVSPLFNVAASQPEEKIWISVTSPNGELLHFDGREVLPLVKAFQKNKSDVEESKE